MGIIIKAFAIFWIVWILWYLTGGPLRDDKSKPFVGFDKNGQIVPMSTSSVKGQ